MDLSEITKILEEFSPIDDSYFPYGTAGFRSNAAHMRHVVHRSGMLAALRSHATQRVVGLCITASHNHGEDNGVKLVDSDGGMLAPEFELYATEFVNSKTPSDYFVDLAKRLGVEVENATPFSGCCVFLGRDTRVSSPSLASIAHKGIEALGAHVVDLGIVTTPQVHFAVRRANELGRRDVAVKDYIAYFEDKCQRFARLAGIYCGPPSAPVLLPERLVCDGANGVGAQHVFHFIDCLKRCLNVDLDVRNDGCWVGERLNEMVGTEYVQKQRALPSRFGPGWYDPRLLRCCSFDGDADRIVYFTSDKYGKLVLLDGDKIGALYCVTIGKILGELSEQCSTVAKEPLRIGVVQTAYANGSSTSFFDRLGAEIETRFRGDVVFELACVKTGVKNLHHKAVEFDVGIYFESNGHGTVIHKSERLEEWGKSKGCLMNRGFQMLSSYLQLFNQATGDAITDMLAVEAALRYLEMSFMEWIRLYTDVPTIQRKVPMPRATLNKLLPHMVHEKILLEPLELQCFIDMSVAQHAGARAFIRPSGTEDVCRLYVEAGTYESCVHLADVIDSELRTFL